MRKAARKQKKLEKSLKESSKPVIILDKNSKYILPRDEVIQIFGDATELFVRNESPDLPGLANAIANSTTLRKLICKLDPLLIQYFTEALKINTSVVGWQILSFGFSEDEDYPLDATLGVLFKCLSEVLQCNRLQQLALDLKADYFLRFERFTEFIIGLKNNTSLTALSLPTYRYGVQHIEALVEAVNSLPHLVDLTFPAGHWNGPEEWQAFSKIILANRLSTLSLDSLDYCNLDTMISVLDALKNNTSLTNLSLAQKDRRRHKRRLSDKACDMICEVLRDNRTLIKLDINGIGVGSDHLSKILDSLHKHPALTQLNFWENKLDNTIAPSLASFLEVNTSLTELDLSNAHLTPDACQMIGPALKKNISITSLSLFMNPIQSFGCKYLAEGLKSNKTLIRVNLKDCQIQDEGCMYLGEAIKTNQCLMHLDISGYDIKVDGYNALIDGLNENTSLTDLTLSKDKSVPDYLHERIIGLQNKNKRYRRTLITNIISILIQIARSDAFDLFPLEIWLRIFKHLVCGGVPGFNHIAEEILMRSDVRDVVSLCKMKIVRINGKSYLVSSDTKSSNSTQ